MTPPARGKTALFALGAVAALAFSMVWNPPTASVHSFTRASDYNAEKESGCTNSGEGCHGDESAYRDFNEYHPNAECTTCHEYEGVGCIPCHAPREHECALCHDGSMKTAPDRVRITDPFPRGHYRETTHTATATDFDRRVLSAKGGEASATCDACHSRDLAASHKGVPTVDGSTYGTDVGCGECHNDVRSFGQAEVLADWKPRSCESCHKVGSSSPVHAYDIADAVEATGTAGCAGSGSGCHVSRDLHALHPDAPNDCSGSAADGEPTCHDLETESHAPTARSCGGNAPEACHRSDDPTGYRHRETEKVHSPSTNGPASDTAVGGVACGACHFMAPDGSSLIAEHERPSSSGSSRGDGACLACHNHAASVAVIENRWESRDSDAACSVCHDGAELDAPHGDPAPATHTSASPGCAGTGAGCHPSDRIDTATTSGAAPHDGCLTCHGTTTDVPATTARGTTCGAGRACHAEQGAYDPATAIHDGPTRTDGLDADHHTAVGLQDGRLHDAVAGTTTGCSACHSAVLGREHARPNSTLAGAKNACTGCHNAGAATVAVVKSDWPARETADACAACHELSASHAPEALLSAHAATEKDYTGAISPGFCSRTGCHATSDVRGIHAEVGCTACHSASGDIRGSGVMTCGGAEGDEHSCHPGHSKHDAYDSAHTATEIDYRGVVGPGGCAHTGCHASADVRKLHLTAACATPGCHVAGGPGAMTCGGAAGTPNACHTGADKHRNYDAKHQATEVAHDGTVGPGGCVHAGCHPSADVRVIHAKTEKYCYSAGCHAEGGPKLMTCGGKDPATSCHVPSTKHLEFADKHRATERDPSGVATPGYCARSGCHASVDAPTVHHHQCYLAGCHSTGGPTVQTCGGALGQTDTCHAGVSDTDHAISHDASREGTVDGVTYGPGENVGCLGVCHAEDLVAEHRIRVIGGGLDGSASSVCALCHAVADSGTFARSTAVVAAVAGGDMRCVACHSSDIGDTATAVAAPPATCIAAPVPSPSIENPTTAEAAAGAPHTARTAVGRSKVPRASTGREGVRRRAAKLRRHRPTPDASHDTWPGVDSNAPPGSEPASHTVTTERTAHFLVSHTSSARRDTR